MESKYESEIDRLITVLDGGEDCGYGFETMVADDADMLAPKCR